jgi:beta-glucanase (GH16 family)
MKLPGGQGIWPAFWMMPQNSVYGGWAASGEIDIMETINLGAAGGNNLYGSIHYGGPWPQDLDTTVEYTPAPNMMSGFHTYAVEWDPGQIRWYFDNVLYSTQTNWSSTGGVYPAPFNQGFYIILNLAVGGNWPGNPTNNAIFPQQLQVQYVRVYQK